MVQSRDVAVDLDKAGLGLVGVGVAVSTEVAFFPECVGRGGHESNQLGKPLVGCFDEVVFFCVQGLERYPFFGKFAAEEMIPADVSLVGDELAVGIR